MTATTAVFGANPDAPKRDQRVDVMRGIACLLLVFYHVVGGNPDDGLRLPRDHALSNVLDFFLYIRMPIFAFISGYVYGMRPVVQGAQKDFMKGKLQRLGVPLLFASTAFFISNKIYIGPLDTSPISDAWRIYIYPYSVYWFLQAMIVIFAVMCILDSLGALQRPETILTLSILIEVVEVILNPNIWIFSLSSAMYLFPYFLVGLAARRFPNEIFGRGMIQAYAVCLTAAMAAHLWNLMTMDPSEPVSRSSFIAFVMGSSASLLLIRLVPRSGFLATIGKYSFSIFLYHIFFAILVRLVLSRAGVTNLTLLILLSMLVAVSGPMMLEEVVRRINLLRPVMLGEWKSRSGMGRPAPSSTS